MALDPNLDEHVWNHKQNRLVRRERRRLNAQSLNLTSVDADHASTHVVVAVHLGPDAPSYTIAGQNHSFEIQQSLKEILGDEQVTTFFVDRTETSESWHKRLLETLIDTEATHLVSQIEGDPNQADSWTWDIVADALARHWNGTWIGVMWDAAYPWLMTRARRLGRINSRLLIADLCQPMSGEIRRSRPEAGPMTMPLSKATTNAILEQTRSISKAYDVTFIGALYDYRVQLLEQVRSLGIEVAVNPHRNDSPSTYDESRANQPTYLNYMKALAASDTTINFSLAAGGPGEQYKIRIQEAAMVACLPVTDDRDRTRQFFRPDQYGYFASVDDLGPTLERLLSDRSRLAKQQASTQERALSLAHTDFWGRVSDAARARKLRAPTELTTPPAP